MIFLYNKYESKQKTPTLKFPLVVENCMSRNVELSTENCISMKIGEPFENFIFVVMKHEKCDEFNNLMYEYLLSKFNDCYIYIIYHEIGWVLLNHVTFTAKKIL